MRIKNSSDTEVKNWAVLLVPERCHEIWAACIRYDLRKKDSFIFAFSGVPLL